MKEISIGKDFGIKDYKRNNSFIIACHHKHCMVRTLPLSIIIEKV
jgi:hypothetical protein